MPLSRDPRMDRRRRVIREGVLNAEDEAIGEPRTRGSRSKRTAQDGKEQDIPQAKRSAGYSQSVRKACQKRLVQFIPVRKRSLTAAVLVSIFLPALLLSLHYGIFVSEWLPWKNHPIAAVLDASHPRSLAAWLGSQLWLLCLAATVVTFQLRRHKLDDYEGEYRLWFWLVLTCLIGSIDSTTRVTELFGAALDRWSQLHVGWSGGAIVQATLAALVGMLGLRLCSELKTVPTSLVLWLIGLICWAGSAALSQSLFKIDLSYQFRIWLRASLWLAGLTSIWVAALYHLRSVYIEAQRRFILRGGLMSAESVPWRERIARVLPKGKLFRQSQLDSNQTSIELEASEYAKVPRGSGGTGLFGMFRKQVDQTESRPGEHRSTAVRPAGLADGPTRAQGQLRSTTLPNQSRMKSIETRNSSDDEQPSNVQPRRSWFGRTKQVQTATPKKRTLGERLSWRRGVDQTKASSGQSEPSKQKSQPIVPSSGVTQQAKATGRKPSSDQPKEAKKRRLRIPSFRMPKLRFPKLRLPKLKLPSFSLPPPDNGISTQQKASAPDGLRPTTNSSRPLPGTGPSSGSSQPNNTPLGESFARSMSKAERKKMRRLGRDDESDQRAA